MDNNIFLFFLLTTGGVLLISYILNNQNKKMKTLLTRGEILFILKEFAELKRENDRLKRQLVDQYESEFFINAHLDNVVEAAGK